MKNFALIMIFGSVLMSGSIVSAQSSCIRAFRNQTSSSQVRQQFRSLVDSFEAQFTVSENVMSTFRDVENNIYLLEGGGVGLHTNSLGASTHEGLTQHLNGTNGVVAVEMRAALKSLTEVRLDSGVNLTAAWKHTLNVFKRYNDFVLTLNRDQVNDWSILLKRARDFSLVGPPQIQGQARALLPLLKSMMYSRLPGENLGRAVMDSYLVDSVYADVLENKNARQQNLHEEIQLALNSSNKSESQLAGSILAAMHTRQANTQSNSRDNIFHEDQAVLFAKFQRPFSSLEQNILEILASSEGKQTSVSRGARQLLGIPERTTVWQRFRNLVR
jgi:hypothetical protein